MTRKRNWMQADENSYAIGNTDNDADHFQLLAVP